MATLAVYPSYDAELQYSHAVYATVHDSATCDVIDDTGDYYNFGQEDGYDIRRIVLQFDTSALTTDATISAATLTIMVYWDKIASTEWDVTVVNGSDVGATAVVADYGDLLDETTSYGTANTVDATDDEPLVITLNSFGLGAISRTGTTKFALRSSRDIGSNAPTDNENYMIYSRNDSTPANRPTLTVTYATGVLTGVIAIVETQLHYVDAFGTERYIEGTAVP